MFSEVFYSFVSVETLSEGHCSGRGCWFCRASTMLTLSVFQIVAGQSGMFPVRSRASVGAASSVAAVAVAVV